MISSEPATIMREMLGLQNATGLQSPVFLNTTQNGTPAANLT